MQLRLLLLRLLVPAVEDVDHDVGGDAVDPRLGDALGVDDAAGVAELMEGVVGGDADRPGACSGASNFTAEAIFPFETVVAAATEVEVPGEGGVPDEVDVVHRGIVVTCALEDAEVGGELQVVEELEVEVGAVVEVDGAAGDEALASGVRRLPADVGMKGGRGDGAEAVGELQVFAEAIVVGVKLVRIGCFRAVVFFAMVSWG